MITTAPRALVLLVTAALVAACERSPACDLPPQVEFGRSTTLIVQVADTPDAQARGLMGRHGLPEDRGMLFEFRAPTTAPFWMKDTLIPLSIAFFDARRRIVAIRDMTPCRASPCHLYRSPRSYVGAVEVNRGYFERHDIRPGDRFRSTVGEACL